MEHKIDWPKYDQGLVDRGKLLGRYVLMPEIIIEIIDNVEPKIKHNDTISQMEQIFRKWGFYTTREYPIFKMKDGSGRAGRIDLIARKGKFRVVVEYDHKYNVKYKSFQKVVQIRPEIGVVIAGYGNLKQNMERADKYIQRINFPFYVVSLKEKNFGVINDVKEWKDLKYNWQRSVVNLD